MIRKRRRLAIEGLEGRELLAGDITMVRYFDTWNGGVIRSSDAAGITFHPPSGHLFLSDSEINEQPIFEGNNIFEFSLTGNTLYDEIASGNNEPTGIAYSEFDGYFYITNDNGQRIVSRYNSNLNSPLLTVSTLDADPTANDPEGVAVDPSNGRIYVVSGSSGRPQVLVYNANLQFQYNFFVDARLPDPEGAAFDPASGHLFVVDGTRRVIAEYTTSGGFVEEYDISGFSPTPLNAGGLTIGPTSSSSDNAENRAFYITDRGGDNVPDGGVYEAVIDKLSGGDPPGGEGVIDVRVNSSTDDAEERADGKVVLTSSDLEMAFDAGGNQVVGLRFQNLDIPQGATITNAYVQFKVDETSSGATSLVIRGHDTNSAPAFVGVNSNISSRTTTSASVNWSPPAWTSNGATGSAQRTPNLSQVIQEIVDRGGWSSGNELALIISGTGERIAESYNGDAAGAPLLHVEFDDGGSSGNQAPTIISISDRSVLQGGTVQLTASANDPDGPNSDLRFSLDSGAPSGASINAVTGQFTWNVPSSQAIGEYDVTVRVTDMGSPPMSDTTTFEIEVNGSGGGGSDTIDVRVSSSTDDAEERASGGVGLTSSDLELAFDKDNQTVGIRFQGVGIPHGATVTNAYVQFQADETSSGATSLTIRGHDTNNAPTFVSANSNISSRTTTSAAINWSPPAWNSKGAAGPDQRTPNLANVIQEIVNRGSWSSGNALALIISGSGKRVAESYNGDASAAPLLHVEFSTSSGFAASVKQASLHGGSAAVAAATTSNAVDLFAIASVGGSHAAPAVQTSKNSERVQTMERHELGQVELPGSIVRPVREPNAKLFAATNFSAEFDSGSSEIADAVFQELGDGTWRLHRNSRVAAK